MRRLTASVLVLLLVATAFAQIWGTKTKGTMQVVREWVTVNSSTVTVGSTTCYYKKLIALPHNAVITDAWIYVNTAFDGTADSCCIGSSSDIDYFVDEIAGKTTGLTDTTPLVANMIYASANSAGIDVYAYVTYTGTPTVGKALFIVEYTEAPKVP